MSQVVYNPADTTAAFNAVNQDAVKPSVSSNTLSQEVQHLLDTVTGNSQFSDAQKATLGAQVQELLPIAGVPGHGDAWNKDVDAIQGELTAFVTGNAATPSTPAAGTPVLVGANGNLYVPAPAAASPSTSTTLPPAPPTTPSVSTSGQNDAPSSLFPSGVPTVDDVKQGADPDCALVSVMQSMAGQQPDAIKNMIHAGSNGGWNVDLYVNGHKTQVPVATSDIQGNGTKSVNHQTDWSSVIEAAVNKVDGDTAQAVPDMATMLTGKPSATLPISSTPNLEQTMQSTLAAGGLVMADTSSMPQGTTSGGQTIYPGHGYSVSGMANGMVTVHNTVGAHTPGDPGITMSMADFERLFSTVTTSPAR